MSWEAFPTEEKPTSRNSSAEPGELRANAGQATAVSPEATVESQCHPAGEASSRSRPGCRDWNLEVRPGSGLWLTADPDVILEKIAAPRPMEARDREREAAEEVATHGRGRREGGPRRRPSLAAAAWGWTGRGGMGFGDMTGYEDQRRRLVVPPAGGAQMQGFEDIREKSWVTVLAKIPIKQQFQMYEDALASGGGFNDYRRSAAIHRLRGAARGSRTDEGTGMFLPLRR